MWLSGGSYLNERRGLWKDVQSPLVMNNFWSLEN